MWTRDDSFLLPGKQETVQYMSCPKNLSVSTHAHTHTQIDSHKHIQVSRHQSGPVVMGFHLSFFFILQFHHSLTSPALPSFFSCLIVLHHLSIAPLFCFSFMLPAFLSLMLSHQPPFHPLHLLPQASCVYISVVYFYKCQTAFLPSVYWSRERERDGGGGVNMEQSKDMDVMGNMREKSEKAATRWAKEKLGYRSGKRWREAPLFKSLFLSDQPQTDLHISPYVSPPCISIHQLKYRCQDNKNHSGSIDIWTGCVHTHTVLPTVFLQNVIGHILDGHRFMIHFHVNYN